MKVGTHKKFGKTDICGHEKKYQKSILIKIFNFLEEMNGWKSIIFSFFFFINFCSSQKEPVGQNLILFLVDGNFSIII